MSAVRSETFFVDWLRLNEERDKNSAAQTKTQLSKKSLVEQGKPKENQSEKLKSVNELGHPGTEKTMTPKSATKKITKKQKG